MGDDIEDMLFLPLAEREAAWQEFINTHIRPSRLLQLGTCALTPSAGEQEHLLQCTSCNNAYRLYCGQQE